MKTFISILPFAVVGMSVQAFSQGQTPKRAQTDLPKHPNILHIVLDDVGYDDLSCYGATDIKTPNMDALASTG
ncbi:MAG: sulfatase-like hydrolase/transferase, partial [Rikenellaceae bacterium]